MNPFIIAGIAVGAIIVLLLLFSLCYVMNVLKSI